jgi:hypothetical protein
MSHPDEQRRVDRRGRLAGIRLFFETLCDCPVTWRDYYGPDAELAHRCFDARVCLQRTNPLTPLY